MSDSRMIVKRVANHVEIQILENETDGMKGASFTQRTVSSISVGGSINLEGFLSSILLSVVIIVTVVIVVVILIVVVVDDVPFILKLSFVIIGWACAFHQDKALSVKVPVANVM
ncbi:hypothetical protein Tco_0805054 [Tanacetum coccineum]